jgi:nucleotide-binding universal stress UspA family protein
MGPITNILFPVNFSESSAAMAAYVKRVAVLLSAKVTLLHVYNPMSRSGFELLVRPPQAIATDHEELAQQRLDSFLRDEFPSTTYRRLLAAGDPAKEIARTAREGGFDLIVLPTHSEMFQRMLLGSTTAKVLNAAECPVMTTWHAQETPPRSLKHRELLCAIGLGEESERLLQFADQLSAEARANLRIIHALDLDKQIQSRDRQEALKQIDELQRKAGTHAMVGIGVGAVKNTLVALARRLSADVLLIGRSSRPGTRTRLRDLTYAIVRDSPFPVLSV